MYCGSVSGIYEYLKILNALFAEVFDRDFGKLGISAGGGDTRVDFIVCRHDNYLSG